MTSCFNCFKRGKKQKAKDEEIPVVSANSGVLGDMTRMRPENIGILAAEIYFPNTFVSQQDLEKYDDVAEGKYTIGLGQESMSVVTDLEDVNSMCMTAISQLLERHNVDPNKIGRLEVGTETVQDKSKSIKSHLMQLFPGNNDMCGVDNVNACYGGTAALLNSIAWIESADWDDRLAIVVASDVAVYAKGPARPTGGAGAVALLIGPNAPLVVERGTTSHFMKHVFDFYKPNPASEYPIVDGPISVSSFIESLDSCYNMHLDKLARKNLISDASMNNFDYFVFHAPYGKLVQKAFARLYFLDQIRANNKNKDEAVTVEPNDTNNGIPPSEIGIESPSGVDKEEGSSSVGAIGSPFAAAGVDQLLLDNTERAFREKTLPTRLIPRQSGNSYCASLYSGLLSLISQLDDSAKGKRIGMFSYGSGLAASMFSINVVADPSTVCRPAEEYVWLLKKRHQIKASEYNRTMEEREAYYCAKDWKPKTPLGTLRSGSYYLERVDEKYRRYYSRTISDNANSDD